MINHGYQQILIILKKTKSGSIFHKSPKFLPSKIEESFLIHMTIDLCWPERVPQAPPRRRGQGAQYKMIVHCREAPACACLPVGRGGELHFLIALL